MMKNISNKKISILNITIRFLYLFLFNILGIYFSTVYATQPSSNPVGGVLESVADKMGDVADLLSSIATVVGVAFIFGGVFKLKHMADMRNMMQGQADIVKAIILIMVGGFFIWMPYLLEVITYTLFRDNIATLQSKYAIAVDEGSELRRFYESLVIILQVIGMISFLRGLFVFAGMAKGQSQPGTFAKGMTHIIAGVFLVNITAFLGMFRDTLAIGADFSFGIR